jgi:hypothetical protein
MLDSLVSPCGGLAASGAGEPLYEAGPDIDEGNGGRSIGRRRIDRVQT